MSGPVILVINPGSTSTRTSLYQGKERIKDRHLDHTPEDLACCSNSLDQIPMRTACIEEFLKSLSMTINDCTAVAARGGPFQPVPGGVYIINDQMLEDASGTGFTDHISRTACIIAHTLAEKGGIPAYAVDLVSTDEFKPVSRISGLKDLPRKSLVHALNMKAVARIYAEKVGTPYSDMNLITAMLGGGISIAVHEKGRMIDSVDANGEGPFSPERCGGLRADSLADMLLDSSMDRDQTRNMLFTKSGLMDHLGTRDMKKICARIDSGDKEAARVTEAMAYSTAKHICALSAAVNGKIDGILLTGGLAHASIFTDMITKRVSFLAPVKVMPGEYEMEALRDGVLRVLSGDEQPKSYPDGNYI